MNGHRIRRITLRNWHKWSRTTMRTLRTVLPKETWISEHTMRAIFHDGNYAAYLATVDNMFAGFAIGFFWNFDDEPEIAAIGDAKIFHLCFNIIAPEFQGQGIGQALIERRVREAAQRGARTCTCFARTGASLHNLQKLGGEIIGTRENYHKSGETFHIVRLNIPH